MDGPCLTDEEVAALVDGRASPALQLRAQRHYRACSACLQLYAHAGAGGPPSASLGSLPAAPPWQPPAQVNEFRIDERLGCGAFGLVYRAWDTMLQRAVAIKFLARPSDDAGRTTFLTEAQALGRIQFHPNIVILLQANEVDQHLYLVSELVHGQTLDHCTGPQPAARVLDVGIGVASGLVEAHRRGVCHRDLKPQNLIRTEQGVIKILDFGLARLVDEGHSLSPPAAPPAAASQPLVGTPLYMAPEVWRGEAASARSDLYSLGAVLYQLCAGFPPHRAADLAALRQLVLTSAPAPLAAVAGQIPRRLAQLIEQCLRRDPRERPASAEEVRRRLQAMADRPRRLLLAGVSLALLLLGGGLALLLPGLLRRYERPRPIVDHPGGVLHCGTDELELLGLQQTYAQDLHPDPVTLDRLRELTLPERPRHRVRVAAFRMLSAEVTNREFADALNQRRAALRVRLRRLPGSVQADPFLYLEGERPLIDMTEMPGFGLRLTAQGVEVVPGLEEHPVRQVTWWGAQRFCQERGLRLPTEFEYEIAVRGAGPHPRLFPWPSDQDRGQCDGVTWRRRQPERVRAACRLQVTVESPFLPLDRWRARGAALLPGLECPLGEREVRAGPAAPQLCAQGPGRPQGTTAVRTAHRDRTPEGIYDLAGNVAEWTFDPYRRYPSDPGAVLPEPAELGRPDEARVVRGGHSEEIAARSRGAFRMAFRPDAGPRHVGFRCAVKASGDDPRRRWP